MSCERSASISELLDHELPTAEAPALVEHLLECRSCATFFRRARALDAALLLSAAEDDAGAMPPPAPPELWRRIGAAAFDEAAPRTLRPRASVLPRWALAAAAAVLLVLGALVGMQAARRSAQPPAPGAQPLAGGSVTFAALGPAPTMDERRFVAIARELLAADSRYRDAMTGVLAVARGGESHEGSTAESSWRQEELRDLRPAAPALR
jgi:anti-sigma factor RsiW